MSSTIVKWIRGSSTTLRRILLVGGLLCLLWQCGCSRQEEVPSADSQPTGNIADSVDLAKLEMLASSPDGLFDTELFVSFVGATDEPLSDTELSQLWKLREQSPDVRVEVLQRYLENEAAAERFNRRAQQITIAAVGLDDDIRQQVARRVVKPALKTAPESSARQQAIIALGLELELTKDIPQLATLATDLRLAELLAADPREGGFSWRQKLEELSAAAANLPSAEASKVYQKLDKLDASSPLNRELREELLPVFASRLPTSEANEIVRVWLAHPTDDRNDHTSGRITRAAAIQMDATVAHEVIVAMLSRVTLDEEIKDFSNIAKIAMEKLDDEAIFVQYAPEIAAAMAETESTEQRQQLARLLTYVDGDLPGTAGLKALTLLAAAPPSANNSTATRLTAEIVEKLPPQVYPTAFGLLVKQQAGLSRRDYESARYLGNALNSMSERAPEEVAIDLVGQIDKLQADPEARSVYYRTLPALEKLIAKLPRELLREYASKAMQTELTEKDDSNLRFVCAVMRGAATRPEEFTREERFRHADKFLRWAEEQQSAAAANSRFQRNLPGAMNSGLQATCEVLAAEDYDKAYQRVSTLHEQAKHDSQKMIATYGLIGLASSLPPDQRTAIIDRFVAILDRQKYSNDDANMVLISWLAGSAAEMSPAEAKQSITAIIQRIPEFTQHDQARLLVLLQAALDARPLEERHAYLKELYRSVGKVAHGSGNSLEEFVEQQMASAPPDVAYELAKGMAGELGSGEKGLQAFNALRSGLSAITSKLTQRQRAEIARRLADSFIRVGNELSEERLDVHQISRRRQQQSQLLQALVEIRTDLPPEDALRAVSHLLDRLEKTPVGDHEFGHLASLLPGLTDAVAEPQAKQVEQRLLARLKSVNPSSSNTPAVPLATAIANLPGQMDSASADVVATQLSKVIETARHERTFTAIEESVDTAARESGDERALRMLAAVLRNITENQQYTNAAAPPKIVPHIVAHLTPDGQRTAWSNTLSRLGKLDGNAGKRAAASCLTDITARLQPSDLPMILVEYRSPRKPEVTPALENGLAQLVAVHGDKMRGQIEVAFTNLSDDQRTRMQRILDRGQRLPPPSFDATANKDQMFGSLRTADELTFAAVVRQLTNGNNLLSPAEMFTLLGYPNCVGSTRRTVLSKLRQRTGKYHWSVWEFVTRGDEIDALRSVSLGSS